MPREKPTGRERIFCMLSALGYGPSAAARAAGYETRLAARAAARLLEREEIAAEIAAARRICAEGGRADGLAGLRRLALADANDALCLLEAGEPLTAGQTAGLDLFAVSEVKRPKGGGYEVKFHDRLAALKLLLEQAEPGAEEGSLLDALASGARSLRGDEEPEPQDNAL